MVSEIEAIVLAAGGGERLNGQPKAFLQLGGETLLERMVHVGAQVAGSVIAAVPALEMDRAHHLVGKRTRLVAGGDTRAATFRLLLAEATAPTIVILDVAHPLVSVDLCSRVLAAADGGAAAAVLRAHDDVIRSDGTSPGRGEPIYLLSKPIVVRLDAVRRGLAAEGASADDGVLTLMRLAGERVELVEAEPWNVKLTTLDDWQMINALSETISATAGPS